MPRTLWERRQTLPIMVSDTINDRNTRRLYSICRETSQLTENLEELTRRKLCTLYN